MRSILLFVTCAGFSAGSAQVAAHPGGIDANGCHYERSNGRDWQDTYHCHEQRPPSRDTAAPVKKSRENICHDAGSPNYSRVQYFVSYKSMKKCTSSGGRACKR